MNLLGAAFSFPAVKEFRFLTRGIFCRIGWGHGKTRIIDVDTYEEARPYRRSQIDMVLTREEREEILMHWGVSFHDIIESIRGNIRVKNQRRQTVTNLGKVERLEEAFESATRKIKRALLLRRRTGDKVKELRERAELAANTLASLKIAEERALNEIHSDKRLVEQEPEEDHLESIDNLGVQVSVSDFCKNSPAESMVRKSSAASNDDPDGASSVDGFTLGNSTTPSILEMEKFYRELELEMFGENDFPPSMIGTTLEIAAIEIPEEDRCYDDPESTCDDPGSVYDDETDAPPIVSGYPIHSSYPASYDMRDSAQPSHFMRHHERHFVEPEDALRNEVAQRHLHGRSLLSRTMEYDIESTALRRQFSYPDEEPMYNHHYAVSHSIFPSPETPPSVNPNFQSARLSQSLDSAWVYPMHEVPRFSQVGYQMPPSAVSAIPSSYHLGPNGPYVIPENQAPTPNLFRVASQDEPQICHNPPPTYLSPTHWMEDRDSPRVRHPNEPVTITEDASYESRIYGFQGMDLAHTRNRYPHDFRQYPTSFY